MSEAVVTLIASLTLKDTFQYKIFKIHFGFSSGEQEAVESKDEGVIGRFMEAVNNAIVYRTSKNL